MDKYPSYNVHKMLGGSITKVFVASDSSWSANKENLKQHFNIWNLWAIQES